MTYTAANVQKANSNSYLGGIIEPGDHIGSSSNKVAKLAPAGATKRGDTPQSRLSTISGDVETAIWSYDSETQELSAQWVNEAGLERTVSTSILGRKDSNGRYSFMLSRRLSGDDDSNEDLDDGSVESSYDSGEDDDFVETRDDTFKDDGSVGGDDSVETREDTFEDGDSVVVWFSYGLPYWIELTIGLATEFHVHYGSGDKSTVNRLMIHGRFNLSSFSLWL